MVKARFKTHAHIKSIIGKDLITDDNIAVLELVKNSFDAGSKKVEIIFKNILKNDDDDKKNSPTKLPSKLIIRDYGVGMSETDIADKWLNIAYSEKKEKKEDYGRMMAGNKGVGRFSCDRLGRFLIMYSRVDGKDYRKLFIDWKLFEKEGDINFNIQDIEFEIETINHSRFEEVTGYVGFKSGTLLEINFLREYWDADKILNLRRHLERLINPNQAFKSNPFAINIIADEFKDFDQRQGDNRKINGLVKNRIFESLNFKTTSIKAEIDSEGKYITSTLQDRGNEIFTLKEKNPYNLLKSISINIYYLSTYSKAYFTKQTGIRSVDFGSIYLFINGFRIPPYGDEGDDWLGMENRKGQGYSRYLGTREVVGRIEIFDQNENFKIISNRSGIVNTLNFEQLTDSEAPYGYYYKIFRRLERYVAEGIKWDSTPINDKEIERLVNSDPNWNESKEIYREDALTRNKRALSVINNIIDAKKEEIAELTINNDFVNEIINEQIEHAQKELEEVIQKISDKANELTPVEISSVINKLSKDSTTLESFSKVLSNYSFNSGNEFGNLISIQESYAKNIERLLKEKKELELQIQQKEEARKLAEDERKRIQEELELEKEKNTYLRVSDRSLSEDAKGLVHNIKLVSKNINSNVDTLYEKIKNDTIKTPEILRRLGTIKFNSEKALKISNLITRANFKSQANSQYVDIAKYIEQYVDVYKAIFESEQTNFSVINQGFFEKKISVLELSLVIDDLISNSHKAGAKNILIKISNINNSLRFLFSDDGNGLIEKFLKNPQKIFELGITSTDGSGIGLASVKKALSSMGAKIDFIGNGIELRGATFEIIFD